MLFYVPICKKKKMKSIIEVTSGGKVYFYKQCVLKITIVSGKPFIKINLRQPLGYRFHMYCQFERTLYCAVHTIALYGTANCFSQSIKYNFNYFRWAISQNQLQEITWVSFSYVFLVYKDFVFCLALLYCIVWNSKLFPCVYDT